MDWLQFSSSIVASLAWPVAIVTSVVLVRRELLQALRRLRRLKYGDAEAEFGEILKEVEEDISVLAVPDSFPAKIETSGKHLQDIGAFSNNSAVFVAWLAVESAILNLARANKILEPNMPASMAAQLLLSRNLIDDATYRAIRELMQLRNIAVHPSDTRPISREEVDRFKALANKVASTLEKWQLFIS